MRIAEINVLAIGSTGKIMFQIAEKASENGNEVYTYSPVPFVKGKKNNLEKFPNHFWWGTRIEAKFHNYVGSLLGLSGLFSYFGTQQLIKSLKKFKPEIIHLHNLHAWYLNFPMLFKYVKKSRAKVVWTLHDCWTFTGHCPHFDMIGCDKWKTGCYRCPQPRTYPKMYLDTSKLMYKLKKKWFTGIRDMTLVTPSQWLADLVKQSFLKEYPVKVINNGIDLSVFKPTESNFREKYGLQDKFIVLGVAFGWGQRKGLDVFIELSKRLNDSFQIVLVGTDDNVDKQLPPNIISIHRTQNQAELAEIYTAADLFVNPTREENFPTVNMEALACGTPIVTFKTGGSPEIIDKTCGIVVEKDDIDMMEQEILRIRAEKRYTKDACLNRAKQFKKDDKFSEYLDLYKG